MFCANCGKQNPDDSKFCESCGAPLADTAAAIAAPAAAAVAYTPPPQLQPQPVYRPPVAPQQPVYAAPVPQQQPYYQQPQQPAYNPAAVGAGAKPLSVGEYILTFIVTAIPLVGFIMLLVWAFGSDTNPNKKNFCRAMLIMMLIGIVLSIIFGGAMFAFFSSMIENGDFTFSN